MVERSDTTGKGPFKTRIPAGMPAMNANAVLALKSEPFPFYCKNGKASLCFKGVSLASLSKYKSFCATLFKSHPKSRRIRDQKENLSLGVKEIWNLVRISQQLLIPHDFCHHKTIFKNLSLVSV